MGVSAFRREQIFVGFAFSEQLLLFSVKLFARCSLYVSWPAVFLACRFSISSLAVFFWANANTGILFQGRKRVLDVLPCLVSFKVNC